MSGLCPYRVRGKPPKIKTKKNVSSSKNQVIYGDIGEGADCDEHVRKTKCYFLNRILVFFNEFKN